MANDAWARFINMRYGPDGNVYVIDWYDKQACHTGDAKVWDRSNGRIYKICYRGTKWDPVDLSQWTTDSLVGLQWHENEWYVRHARRHLQERGSLLDAIVSARKLSSSDNIEDQKLGARRDAIARRAVAELTNFGLARKTRCVDYALFGPRTQRACSTGT